MKPTDNQKKLIQALINEIQSWDNNDIDSPTNHCEIGDDLYHTHISIEKQELLQSLLGDILSIVQEYK